MIYNWSTWKLFTVILLEVMRVDADPLALYNSPLSMQWQHATAALHQQHIATHSNIRQLGNNIRQLGYAWEAGRLKTGMGMGLISEQESNIACPPNIGRPQ